MKPCKGCRHFRDVIFGPYCMHGVDPEWEDYIEPLSGERRHRRTTHIKAEDMRSADGKCGPGRTLYDTNWQAFLRWIWRER